MRLKKRTNVQNKRKEDSNQMGSNEIVCTDELMHRGCDGGRHEKQTTSK